MWAKSTCLLPATSLYSLIGLVPAANAYGNVFTSKKYAYHERRARAISFGRYSSLRIPWEDPGYVSNDTEDQDMIPECEDFCTWVFVVVDDICGKFTEGLTNFALKGGKFH